MTSLNVDLLPYASHLKTKSIDNQLYVWDPCRRKDVRLEPEEFVRQITIHYLHESLNIGFGRIIVEKQVQNYQKNRFDIGIRKPDGTWSLLIECKSYKINLDQDAVLQVAKYNMEIQANYIMMTNGKNTFIWQPGNELQFISDPQELLNKF